jgi:hypothetical protein
MKKPARTTRVLRSLQPAELAKPRGGNDGGVAATDDWEAPVAGNRVWQDDWLAPT